jgi:hypothetical protein
VFAIPVDREFPFPDRVRWDHPGTRLKGVPEWADSDLGKYLEGDGSPVSYFESSSLQREASAVAAGWHVRSGWADQIIIRESVLQPNAAGDEAAAESGKRPAGFVRRMLDFLAQALGRRRRIIYLAASITPEGKISFEGWEWVEPAPEDWRPVVYANDAALATVEFYTYHQQFNEVERHRDAYHEGYSFTRGIDGFGGGGGGGWLY